MLIQLVNFRATLQSQEFATTSMLQYFMEHQYSVISLRIANILWGSRGNSSKMMVEIIHNFNRSPIKIPTISRLALFSCTFISQRQNCSAKRSFPCLGSSDFQLSGKSTPQRMDSIRNFAERTIKQRKINCNCTLSRTVIYDRLTRNDQGIRSFSTPVCLYFLSNVRCTRELTCSKNV